MRRGGGRDEIGEWRAGPGPEAYQATIDDSAGTS